LQGSRFIVVSKIQLSKLFIEINPIPSYMLKSYFLDILNLIDLNYKYVAFAISEIIISRNIGLQLTVILNTSNNTIDQFNY
jgi:hypothetical protein